MTRMSSKISIEFEILRKRPKTNNCSAGGGGGGSEAVNNTRQKQLRANGLTLTECKSSELKSTVAEERVKCSVNLPTPDGCNRDTNQEIAI